ncbi:hypothetical protein D3C87_2101800 [compost metagenome]
MPVSPACSVRSTSDQSVVPKGMLLIFIMNPAVEAGGGFREGRSAKIRYYATQATSFFCQNIARPVVSSNA